MLSILKKSSLFLMFLAVASFATIATANTLETIKNRGEIIVGVKTQYPPFGFVDSSGVIKGFDVDYAHYFAKKLFGDPNKVQLVSVTSGNRIPYLQSKKIDVIAASMNYNEKRAEVVDFVQPYFQTGSLVMVPKDSSVTGVKDLNGKTVAIIQGSVQKGYVQELAPKAKIMEFGNAPECIQALRTGRADAYVHDDTVILYTVTSEDGFKAVGEAFHYEPMAMAVRKGDTELRDWINGVMDEMKKDGTFQEIWNKWFGDFKDNLKKPF